VLAPRAGVKDRCNVVPELPFPALLAPLAGVEVVDISSQLDDAPVRFSGGDGVLAGTFHGWSEQIEPAADARVLALFEDGDFAETPAITSHPVGAGRVVYIAGVADVESLRALYQVLAAEAGLGTAVIPGGVECVQLRRSSGEVLLVLLNHAGEERIVELDGDKRDLLSGADHAGSIRLAPYGVALLIPVHSAVAAV
jgi:beta-galactosidase